MARTQNTPSKEPKAPDFIAWHVQQKGEKTYWNKVGACWGHKDKKGMTLHLEVVPLGGRIILRQPSEQKPEGEGARS